MARNEELYTAVLKGQHKRVQEVVQAALAGGASAVELMTESMIPAMRDIGDRFARNEAYVPEMLISARAMNTGLQIIEPIIRSSGASTSPAKVCIGTVKGDLHDIGKNLVAMMLKGAGFEVMDLGVDCDAEKFMKAVGDGAQAVLLSALLTTTMPYMKTVVERLKDRPDVKVIIGGAPVTQQYADEIGAHGYSDNAGAAVRVVERCLGVAAA
jgi:5-methyltetrahydrofolate--homocysteine methyltransferase